MIPRHRPPFGAGRVLAAALGAGGERGGLPALEAAWAGAGRVPHAVWVPSARAALFWALAEALAPGAAVVCPAYTCVVVHEAVIRAGRDLRLVDTRPDLFLPDESAMGHPAGGHAVIVSELYGHPADLERLARAPGPAPRLRVIDMAMSIPSAGLLERLRGNDVALVSFGPCKCLYAGWGAMAFTRDDALASALRRERDAALSRPTWRLALGRAAYLFTRTLAHHRLLYGRLRQRMEPSSLGESVRGAEVTAFPAAWRDDRDRSDEWRLPSTGVDRALIRHNLARTAAYVERRTALAERYRRNLRGAAGLVLPPESPWPLSHFTVRVAAGERARIRSALLSAGIDLGMVFGYPGHLAPRDYPNAARIASEILNLPINADLAPAEADRISEHLRRAVAAPA